MCLMPLEKSLVQYSWHMLFHFPLIRTQLFQRGPGSQTSNYRQLNWWRWKLWSSALPLGLCFKAMLSTGAPSQWRAWKAYKDRTAPGRHRRSLEVFGSRLLSRPNEYSLRLHGCWGGFHATFFPFLLHSEWDWHCTVTAIPDILHLLSIFSHRVVH